MGSHLSGVVLDHTIIESNAGHLLASPHRRPPCLTVTEQVGRPTISSLKHVGPGIEGTIAPYVS